MPAKTPRTTSKASRNAERFDVHQAVTDRIIEILERGTRPWVHPWKRAGQGAAFPKRHNGERYKGMNVLLLWATAMEMGYRSPFWMTFRQAKEYGASVRKGEKGAMVIKYGTLLKNDEGVTIRDIEADEQASRIGYLRSYKVFNAEQIEGLPDQFNTADENSLNEAQAAPLLDLESYFGGVGAKIVTRSTNPCYVPALDEIRMPPIAEFSSSVSYYSTLSHELGHWASVPKRLDLESKRKGREGYAFNELCAELSAVFIMGEVGLIADLESSAAYLDSWLKALRSDKRFIFEASSLAQRAAVYIADRAGSAPLREAA